MTLANNTCAQELKSLGNTCTWLTWTNYHYHLHPCLGIAPRGGCLPGTCHCLSKLAISWGEFSISLNLIFKQKELEKWDSVSRLKCWTCAVRECEGRCAGLGTAECSSRLGDCCPALSRGSYLTAGCYCVLLPLKYFLTRSRMKYGPAHVIVHTLPLGKS